MDVFFNLDEFLSVPKETTIKNVTDSLLGYTQFTIEQRTMSSNLCYLDDDPDRIYRKWGIEKMIYRDTKRGIHREDGLLPLPRDDIGAPGALPEDGERHRCECRRNAVYDGYHHEGGCRSGEEIRAPNDWFAVAKHSSIMADIAVAKSFNFVT
ncbi:hypothetical protein R6Q57_023385 [Mikania cordata]